ncbi:hypothetical protein ACIF9R_34800 [Streptomyces sp. NPDC086080]|uniref:hypothetical protein n=1 Tax=Streptomyces sp. NPDC086080 TaxID=3365748 RepID=UPI0037D1A0E5
MTPVSLRPAVAAAPAGMVTAVWVVPSALVPTISWPAVPGSSTTPAARTDSSVSTASGPIYSW